MQLNGGELWQIKGLQKWDAFLAFVVWIRIANSLPPEAPQTQRAPPPRPAALTPPAVFNKSSTVLSKPAKLILHPGEDDLIGISNVFWLLYHQTD